MKSSLIFTSLLLALAPLTVHAQIITMQGGSMPFGIAGMTMGGGTATTSSDRVQVTMTGTTSDTTFSVTPDSAVGVLKAAHEKVIFIDSLRCDPKALQKLEATPRRISSIRIEQGDDVVKQYGDAAKAGVLTVKTKPLPKPAKPDTTASK